MLTQKMEYLQGCKKLWLAVLEMAIYDAIEYHQHKTGIKAKSRYARNPYLLNKKKTGYHWFFNPSSDVGSFIWVCEMLDLNEHFIRNALRRRFAMVRQIDHSRCRAKITRKAV